MDNERGGYKMERLQRINNRLAVDDLELHCGDGLEIMVRGTWVPGRVEYDHGPTGWYLVVNQEPGDEMLAVRLYPGILAQVPE